MKIVFAGTPAVAIPTLHALIHAGHEIALVVTRKDAPQGRKRILTESPVAIEATKYQFPVLKTNSFDDHDLQIISELNADIGVVVAYGGLIPQKLLDALPYGWINLHFSALPEFRGAAPVQWALREGRNTISSTVFRLVEELDAGDIFSTEHHPIPINATSGETLEILAELGSKQVVNVLADIASGRALATSQLGEPTLARKLNLEDGHLKSTISAKDMFNIFRSATPEPGSWVHINGERMKLLSVELCNQQGEAGTISLHDDKVLLFSSDGALELVEIQPAGKSRMKARDWWRGLRVESIEFS